MTPKLLTFLTCYFVFLIVDTFYPGVPQWLFSSRVTLPADRPPRTMIYEYHPASTTVDEVIEHNYKVALFLSITPIAVVLLSRPVFYGLVWLESILPVVCAAFGRYLAWLVATFCDTSTKFDLSANAFAALCVVPADDVSLAAVPSAATKEPVQTPNCVAAFSASSGSVARVTKTPATVRLPVPSPHPEVRAHLVSLSRHSDQNLHAVRRPAAVGVISAAVPSVSVKKQEKVGGRVAVGDVLGLSQPCARPKNNQVLTAASDAGATAAAALSTAVTPSAAPRDAVAPANAAAAAGFFSSSSHAVAAMGKTPAATVSLPIPPPQLVTRAAVADGPIQATVVPLPATASTAVPVARPISVIMAAPVAVAPSVQLMRLRAWLAFPTAAACATFSTKAMIYQHKRKRVAAAASVLPARASNQLKVKKSVRRPEAKGLLRFRKREVWREQHCCFVAARASVRANRIKQAVSLLRSAMTSMPAPSMLGTANSASVVACTAAASVACPPAVASTTTIAACPSLSAVVAPPPPRHAATPVFRVVAAPFAHFDRAPTRQMWAVPPVGCRALVRPVLSAPSTSKQQQPSSTPKKLKPPTLPSEAVSRAPSTSAVPDVVLAAAASLAQRPRSAVGSAASHRAAPPPASLVPDVVLAFHAVAQRQAAVVGVAPRAAALAAGAGTVLPPAAGSAGTRLPRSLPTDTTKWNPEVSRGPLYTRLM
ncbi:hypothetical protein MBANPS3_011468 [Mucor bainieri]